MPPPWIETKDPPCGAASPPHCALLLCTRNTPALLFHDAGMVRWLLYTAPRFSKSPFARISAAASDVRRDATLGKLNPNHPSHTLRLQFEEDAVVMLGHTWFARVSLLVQRVTSLAFERLAHGTRRRAMKVSRTDGVIVQRSLGTRIRGQTSPSQNAVLDSRGENTIPVPCNRKRASWFVLGSGRLFYPPMLSCARAGRSCTRSSHGDTPR